MSARGTSKNVAHRDLDFLNKQIWRLTSGRTYVSSLRLASSLDDLALDTLPFLLRHFRWTRTDFFPMIGGFKTSLKSTIVRHRGREIKAETGDFVATSWLRVVYAGDVCWSIRKSELARSLWRQTSKNGCYTANFFIELINKHKTSLMGKLVSQIVDNI